ncbi:MAG: glucokinase, partial [Candidatus Electrothrix sp. AW2]|nr:glucokinase [Candidatus Electrothrix gigas]
IKNPFLVDNESFRNEFLQSETTAKDLLQQIDVFLIKDERIGLFGAAQYQWLVNLN